MVVPIPDQINLAQQHYHAGRLVDAESAFRQVVEQEPQRVEAWFWLALIADQLGKPTESIAYYGEVLGRQPNSAEAHGNLGSVLLKVGRLEEAIAHHRQSLQFMPDNAKAHYNLAIALYQHHQVEDAIDHYRQAVALMPHYANAHHNLGMALYKQGKKQEAIEHYRQAIELEPSHASAHNSLGVALYQQGDLDEAVEQYRQAIALQPTYVSAHDNLGIVLKQQKKLEEAVTHFQQAIALNPSYANAYMNLGNTLRELGRFDQAISDCQEAIRLQPTNADAHNTYGCILVDLGRFEEAIACFEEALRHRPDFSDGHLNLGIILLQIGDFQRGFAEYHWRWRTQQCPDLRYTEALWQGQELNGKTILLTAEQGFGDTIQFARYATLVAQRGGRVVIACQKPLMRLLATVPGVTACADRDRDNVETHTHAPLLELPCILGTTLETIPANIPYLTPPPNPTIRLHTPPDTRLKIGFVWATNPTNSTSGKRSCPLKHFLSLLEIPGIALYSLQKELSDPDRQELQAWLQSHDRLQDLQDQLSDFADTAAAIAQLDQVITVDTAVAHLAGALGKPTWTLLPYIADWRWLINREDSPWYPTMRLLRQNQPNDWDELFTRIHTQLHTTLPPLPPPPSALPTPPSVLPPSALPLPGFNRIKPCRHGIFLYNVSDLTIGRSLDLYGEWSEGEVNLFQSLLQLGNTVVEIGSRIGAHTVSLAKFVGLQGRILAIEPQHLVFQTLCANLALNGITNTHCYPVAFGNAPGFLTLSDVAPRPSIPGSAAPPIPSLIANRSPLGETSFGEQIQVTTLDSFNLPQCRLIKLEVGGKLLAVLQGATQTIQQHHPAIYLVSDTPNDLFNGAAYLTSLGYDLYWHRPPLYQAQNFFQVSRNVFGTRVRHNMLGFHRSLNVTVTGMEKVTGLAP
jgi:FkbM family methyltransferase